MTVDQKALELLPCPFCGSPAYQFGEDTDSCWVGCNKCPAELGSRLNGEEGVFASRAEAVAAWNRRALPTSDQPFPSHRFDGAMEVPSYTSNSSAPASDHAGLVEKEIRTLLCSFVAEHFPENKGWKPLPDIMGMISQLDNAITIARDYRSKLEAATALSAGVRATVKPLDWIERVSGVMRAETILGDYRVWTHHEADGVVFWQLSDGGVKANGSGTEAECFAAAQADYERRILSALSDAPVVTEEQRVLDALRPFCDAVFNDNGDITVNGPYPHEFTVAAYFAYRKLSAALEASE